ncbi:UDP-glucuronosyltransferase [Drosophila subpulchrella]|uniref:UDP-glucuronosyltransferase n=1 Tax=Drosophila subpulchrella TaxID=1486046 RepID=UPI0018A17978|nr:UDP-glucuronosyltransferase [Drosophila subpulchrella]
MKGLPVSRSHLWFAFTAFFLLSDNIAPVESHHILGLFVNVHRSQLMVHLAVCRALSQKGHHLTLVTTLPLEEQELRGNVSHILIPWKQPEEEQRGSSSDLIWRLERMFKRLERSGDLLDLPEWKKFLKNAPNIPYGLLLLGYHFNDHLLGVAAHFNCPVAIISTQQPTGFVNSLMGNPEERWYVPQPYDGHQRSGISAWIFGVWEKLMEVLARRVLARIYSVHFPEPRYPSFETMRQSVALALNNHHMISEGPIAPLLPNMVDIGGIVLEQKSVDTSLEISTSNRSIIIFSLGTRFTWRKSTQKLLETFTKAFAHFADYDIYWTYDGPNRSAISLDNPHLKVAKWWPQSQLLASGKVRLCITHGGKGSLSEALYYGVPMLGLPLIGDQRGNLQRMQSKNWGLTLSTHNLTHFELAKTMDRILRSPSYAESISIASQIYRDRPMKSSNLANYWIEYIIRHKGARNLCNPARQLNVIEYYAIDVYVIIYGVLILTITILRKINRLL